MTEEKYTPEELNFIAIEDETNFEANDQNAVAVQIEKITDRQRQITPASGKSLGSTH